ncbi:MAG TPA: gamma-glutamyl-gamma-aminobutyrate hydrolase family protein [Anaerolineaceae bacterium]|nr:gamma-glutamyl-gamma-aminobutyrate hydrolase family protein [Anaerolineaceae bacterium]
MNTAPIIGVTTGRIPTQTPLPFVGANESYLRAIRRAGGIPMLIPVGNQNDDLECILERLDGLLLTGGGDIDPVRFNGAPHPRVYDIDEARDQQEIDLVKQAITADLPFLAICRGVQVLNVALGGTLYTDIEDQKPNALKHDWFPDHPRNHLAHKITVQEDSLLHAILNCKTTKANSLHHQGIDQLAPDLKAVAVAPDGLIEAVETNTRFGLGVQWHPEWLTEDAKMQALFRALIEMAVEKD